MCRWLTYSGEPIYLEKLLFEPENSLIQQSLHARKAAVATNGDGFGVGWYGGREQPGLYREILPAWNDCNLKNLAHHISSPLFFAHVRASTGTATSRANCHPFARGKWLFMHNGQIGGYDRVRRKLESSLPDGLYGDRLGTTDSELMFLMMFNEGLERDPAPAVTAVLRQTLAAMTAAQVNEPLKMTAALSDGEHVHAVRYSSADTAPTLYWRCQNGNLIIVSEPLDKDNEPWREVPPGHILTARRGCEVVVWPIGL